MVDRTVATTFRGAIEYWSCAPLIPPQTIHPAGSSLLLLTYVASGSLSAPPASPRSPKITLNDKAMEVIARSSSSVRVPFDLSLDRYTREPEQARVKRLVDAVNLGLRCLATNFALDSDRIEQRIASFEESLTVDFTLAKRVAGTQHEKIGVKAKVGLDATEIFAETTLGRGPHCTLPTRYFLSRAASLKFSYQNADLETLSNGVRIDGLRKPVTLDLL